VKGSNSLQCFQLGVEDEGPGTTLADFFSSTKSGLSTRGVLRRASGLGEDLNSALTLTSAMLAGYQSDSWRIFLKGDWLV
jgi:hypothetical protein